MSIGMMLHMYGQSSRVLGTRSNLRKDAEHSQMKKLQTSLGFARKHGLMKKPTLSVPIK
jgi:hypothetical protein